MFGFLLDKERLGNTWCREISAFPSPWPFPRVQLLVLGRSWEHHEKGQEVLLLLWGCSITPGMCWALLHPLTSPGGSQLPNFQQNSGWGTRAVLEQPEPAAQAAKAAAGLQCPAQGGMARP